MNRWMLAIAIALAGVSTVASPAIADEPDTTGGLVPSERLASPTLIAGLVTAPDGSPAPGVPVVIRVWPDSETLGRLPIGATVQTAEIAATTTDAVGHYELRADPAQSIERYADRNGVVSFDVVAGEGAASVSFALTRKATQLAATNQNDSEARVAPTQVDLRLSAASASSDAEAPTACILSKLASYGPQWAVVGETYTHAGSTAKFTYTAGSTSTLGVGVSSGGIFTAGGTASVTNSATIGFPTTPVNSSRQWRTQFQYDKFTDLCGHIYARPTSFLGGAGIVYAPTISATYCVPQTAGSNFTKSTTTASTISTGVDSSSAIGIDLSARTGFTTTAKVTYTFSSSGKMCGTAGYPGNSPGRLAAKP